MMNKEELSCQEVVELITDYLEHALLPETQAQFEQHLADCPGCITYLKQVQQTIEMLRRLSTEEFPGTREELIEVFRNWKQGYVE